MCFFFEAAIRIIYSNLLFLDKTLRSLYSGGLHRYSLQKDRLRFRMCRLSMVYSPKKPNNHLFLVEGVYVFFFEAAIRIIQKNLLFLDKTLRSLYSEGLHRFTSIYIDLHRYSLQKDILRFRMCRNIKTEYGVRSKKKLIITYLLLRGYMCFFLKLRSGYICFFEKV